MARQTPQAKLEANTIRASEASAQWFAWQLQRVLGGRSGASRRMARALAPKVLNAAHIRRPTSRACSVSIRSAAFPHLMMFLMQQRSGQYVGPAGT